MLQRLVPGARPGTTVEGVAVHSLAAEEPFSDAGADVIVTGFHAALPPAWPDRMARLDPVWINLEYLSAEPWVDDFHGLPSPRPGGQAAADCIESPPGAGPLHVPCRHWTRRQTRRDCWPRSLYYTTVDAPPSMLIAVPVM